MTSQIKGGMPQVQTPSVGGTTGTQGTQSAQTSSIGGRIAQFFSTVGRGIQAFFSAIGNLIARPFSSFSAKSVPVEGSGRVAQSKVQEDDHFGDALDNHPVFREMLEQTKFAGPKHEGEVNKLMDLMAQRGVFVKGMQVEILQSREGDETVCCLLDSKIAVTDKPKVVEALTAKVGEKFDEATGEGNAPLGYSTCWRDDITRDTYTFKDGKTSEKLHADSKSDIPQTFERLKTFCGGDAQVALNMTRLMNQNPLSCMVNVVGALGGLEMDTPLPEEYSDTPNSPNIMNTPFTPNQRQQSVEKVEGGYVFTCTQAMSKNAIAGPISGSLQLDPTKSSQSQSMTFFISDEVMKNARTPEELMGGVTFQQMPTGHTTLVATCQSIQQ